MREHHYQFLDNIEDSFAHQAETTESWLDVYGLRQEETSSILKALYQSSVVGENQVIF